MDKQYPEYADFKKFIADILEQLLECDSHSDFDAVLGRFIHKVAGLNFDEYR